MSDKIISEVLNEFGFSHEFRGNGKTNFSQYIDIKFYSYNIINKLDKIVKAIEFATGENIDTVPQKNGVIRFNFKKKVQDDVNFWANLENTPNDAILLGSDENGETVYMPIDAMPHLLISGTTGSGKSVLMHSVILSSMFRCKASYLFIDPKEIEFSIYKNYGGVIGDKIYTNAIEACSILKSIANYMDKTYSEMAKGKFTKSKIFVIIDELADLMLSSYKKEIETSLVRIAQKGRAAGIHLICATQRPMTSVLTGLLKSNLPTKIALKTASATDSVSVLGHKGAEKLMGKGDAILQRPDSFNEIHFKAPYLPKDQILKALYG